MKYHKCLCFLALTPIEVKIMKEGFTVEEIEKFGKTHKLTILLSTILLLSAIFNVLLWDSLSVWLVSLAAIGGLCFPEHSAKFLIKLASFVVKQDRTVRMIFAGVAIAVSVVFPPLNFLALGLIAGVALKGNLGHFASKKGANEEKKNEEKKEDE